MSKAAKQLQHDPAFIAPAFGSEHPPSIVSIQTKPTPRKATVRARKRARAVQYRIPSRTPSKGEVILNLLRRKNGASIAEMQKATGWQAHSVRGFLSGMVKKRLRLKLKSIKPGEGDRRYLVVGA